MHMVLAVAAGYNLVSLDSRKTLPSLSLESETPPTEYLDTFFTCGRPTDEQHGQFICLFSCLCREPPYPDCEELSVQGQDTLEASSDDLWRFLSA